MTSLHGRTLSDNLERHNSSGNADVEGIDVAWHRDDEMVVDTFEVCLADAVFLRTHHYCNWPCKVGLPDGLLAFFGKRYHFESARLQEIDGVFDIFNTTHIN